MSIINNAHPESQLDLMSLAYRVISRASGEINKSKLLDLCQPKTLAENDNQKKMFPGVIRYWGKAKHNLWSEEGNVIRLKKSNAFNLEREIKVEEIRDILRHELFASEIESITDDSFDGLHKLFTILCCVLSLGEFSVLSASELDKTSLSKTIAKYLSSGYNLNNDELNVTIEFAYFLGFLEPQGQGYVVDPTEAVRSVLPSILIQGERVHLNDFIEKLSKKLPVLDRGNFRREVEVMMSQRDFLPNTEEELSESLSHALYRLYRNKIINLENLSDDINSLTFQLPINQKKQFSSIELL